MKKLILLNLILFLPLIISAQNLNGRFSSSFYTFERYYTTGDSETYIRSFQALNLNFNYDKFSLRTRTNLESNISKTLDNDARLRFYNLYLEGRNLFKVATIKLGRQPLFTPVAGGLFDGVSMKIKYSDFAVSGYYGGNVPAYQKLEMTDDLANDYVLGGKIETTALKDFRFTVSYIDKNFRTYDYDAYRLDDDRDPITRLIQQKSNQYKYLTGEVFYNLENVDISTRYEYDLNYAETSKFEIDSRFSVTKDIGITGYYNFREPKIRYNSIFSIFNYGSTEEIEGGFDLRVSDLYTLTGKVGYVSYEDDHSTRITLGANTNYGSLSYRKNFGYAGELESISLYTAKSFAEGFVTPSLGLSVTNYKLSADNGANNITSLSAGCNVRPWRTFSFDIQGQYFNNKIYENDFRVLFKVNYLFNTNF